MKVYISPDKMSFVVAEVAPKGWTEAPSLSSVQEDAE